MSTLQVGTWNFEHCCEEIVYIELNKHSKGIMVEGCQTKKGSKMVQMCP